MYIKELRPGDSFTHHEYGRATVKQIMEGRASLCSSDSCSSFLVGEDYFAKDPEFYSPRLSEGEAVIDITPESLAEVANNFSDDDFAKFLCLLRQAQTNNEGPVNV